MRGVCVMRMCNMCSVAATRGALITQQQPQRQQNQRYANLTVSIRRKRAPLTFGLSSPTQRERDSYPSSSPPFSVCFSLAALTSPQLMCTFTYACAGVCLYVYDKITFVTHTHMHTTRQTWWQHTHTYTQRKKNKIFVMSLLSHIKVQVQPIW